MDSTDRQSCRQFRSSAEAAPCPGPGPWRRAILIPAHLADRLRDLEGEVTVARQDGDPSCTCQFNHLLKMLLSLSQVSGDEDVSLGRGGSALRGRAKAFNGLLLFAPCVVYLGQLKVVIVVHGLGRASLPHQRKCLFLESFSFV